MLTCLEFLCFSVSLGSQGDFSEWACLTLQKYWFDTVKTPS